MNTIIGAEILREYEGRISGKAAAVFMNLVKHSNEENTCFPSLNRIHRETFFSKRTVQRGLDELLNVGLITKEHNYREDGSQSSNTYCIIAAVEERVEAIEKNINQKKADLAKKLQQIRDNKEQCKMKFRGQFEENMDEKKSNSSSAVVENILAAVRGVFKVGNLSMGA